LNQGCPYCSGKKVSKENSLANNRPDLCEQWHPTKNENLTPNDVTQSSGRRVWWKCSNCEHEFEANINNRTRSSGKCPSCKKK
jgi:DNA-directed RNA polymerase subunit RPC12/RpoP